MKNPYKLTVAILCLGCVGLIAIGVRAQDEAKVQGDSPVETKTQDEKELAPPDPDALRLVQESRTRLFNYESVQADFTQRVVLGSYRFKATGRYLSGKEFRSRLEYVVQLGQMQGDFLEVCDGQILHTRRQVSRKQQTPVGQSDAPVLELTRRDIQKILGEVKLHLDEPASVRAAEIGIGGIPAILASLERTMIFEAIKEDVENGMPVIAVQARWNPEEHGRLITGLGGLAAQLEQFLPDRVRITFNKETLFPQKFQYLQKFPDDKSTYKPILTVEYTNVQINQPIPLQQFSYLPPPGMEERDETASFIEAIKQAAAPPVKTPVKEEKAL